MIFLPQLAGMLQSLALMELFGRHVTFESSRAEKAEAHNIRSREVRTRASSQPTALEGAACTQLKSSSTVQQDQHLCYVRAASCLSCHLQKGTR